LTPLGYLQEKGYSALIKIPFQCMTLMCDGLSALSPENLRLCISTLGQFGRQADTNFVLTAAESLFCSVSDAIQAKRHEADHEADHEAAIQRALDAPLTGDSVPVCGRPARGTDGRDIDVI
jgi:protein MON2